MNSKTIVWVLIYEVIKITLLFLFFGSLITLVSAHQPKFPNPSGPDDYILINEPTVSKAYYGLLADFPHTYRLEITEPTTFFTEILVPEFVNETNRYAILVKEEKRGVSTVTRLDPANASWETFFEPFGGDTYRRGSTYETVLEPGNYLFEVSTPENLGKYVLVVGKEERMSDGGFFASLKDIYKVKVFMDKPFFMVLQSPFYYVPTIFIILTIILVWYRIRKHKSYA